MIYQQTTTYLIPEKCVKPQTVIIFMATYNGQAYLREQLDSIVAQTYPHWVLLVSDDGSKDDTLSILKEYQKRLGSGKVVIQEGPRKGFAANFLAMVCRNDLDGAYFAFADQDDIWLPDKFQRAIDWLSQTAIETPALYCARTELTNQNGLSIGHSPLFKKPLGFLNALVQSVGGGNTMMFNKAMLNLLREAGENINIVSHDWWAYMLVTGAGGLIFYDPTPSILYRQHGGNLVGSNVGWLSRLSRISLLLKGRFKNWNDRNFSALSSIKHLLTEDNQRALMRLMEAKNAGLLSRIKIQKQLGIYRQTCLGNLGLVTALLLKKM
jgi:glycosyltransferase involved in cell wall biosynthesis